MKLHPLALANTMAITIIVSYLVCVLAILVAPNLSIVIMKSWFHGIDISKIASLNINWNSFLTGIISITLVSWLVGYFFAKVYNSFVK